MRSGRTRPLPESAAAAFFLDRGLGVRFVADAIRARGHQVLPMVDVYPNGADQRVGDDEWIARASSEGWIALTKDYSIVRDHADALARSTLRMFALSNSNLTGPQMAERYVLHLDRILQRAKEPGPYVDTVMAIGLERRWPR
ncbi:MAG: hypothetical protein JWM34_4642 [Ilumatobacteraceae bacterium]|nr:hypothetical protein [Ilumatobacteraceae bacterium]